MKTLVLILMLLSVSGLASAESMRYVTDETKIPVRTGKSLQNKILRMVPSGTIITVLEETEDGYSLVKTAEGIEGWMLTRYLMDEPSGRDQLADLQRRFEQLESKSNQYKGKVYNLASGKEELEMRNRELQGQNHRLTEELESLRRKAARPIEISRQNSILQQQLEEGRVSLRKLQNENQLLKEKTKRNWFLTGAGVTLGSLFLGLIIPRIPWRKRRSWDEL